MNPVRTILSVLLVAGSLSLLLYQFDAFNLKESVIIGVLITLVIYVIPKLKLSWKGLKSKNIN